MSGWGSWFGGGGSQAQRDAPKNAILQLRSQLEMLSKREKHLQSQAEEQDALARKYVSSNKNAAKAALRRKKQFEHALDQTQAQVQSLEREIFSIESANINKETLEAMKNAKKAMQQIHGTLTIDKVDQTMEELREQHALGEEIADVISQSNNAMDEGELEDELDAMQQEVLDEQMLRAGNAPVADQVSKLPAAANTERKITRDLLLTHTLTRHNAVKSKPSAEEEDEDEELRKLQAEMAM